MRWKDYCELLCYIDRSPRMVLDVLLPSEFAYHSGRYRFCLVNALKSEKVDRVCY